MRGPDTLRHGAFVRWAALALVALVSLQAETAGLERARELRNQGRAAAAARLYERLLPKLSGADLYDALDALAEINTARGAYDDAVAYAERAADLAAKPADPERRARALNRAGLARLHQGRYPEALVLFRGALAIDQAAGNSEGQVLRWNNIGLIHFYEGAYADARAAYAQALGILDRNMEARWRPRWRYVTIANLATLLQRLGRLREALDLYLSIRDEAASLPAAYQARLRGNLGALYRHLGDPEKALDQYRRARRLFARERDLDGELGVLKNSGIALALDLRDLPAALRVFDHVRVLARRSGDKREEMHASLYRGVVLFELERWSEAAAEFEQARAASAELRTPEEEWKALYWLGRGAARRGDSRRALSLYRQAIGLIESLRSGIPSSGLRTEFLADKRDVYDALIGLTLQERGGSPVAEALGWMERSRARAVQDVLRRQSADRKPENPPAALQARLPDDTVLLVYWRGRERAAVLWFTANGLGVRRFAWSVRQERRVLSFARRLAAGPSSDWREHSTALGRELLAGLPPLSDERTRHVIIVPDGTLGLLPFETLGLPGSPATAAPRLLIERYSVHYLPASAVLLRPPPRPAPAPYPWRSTLLAFANPATNEASTEPLPGAEREVAAIARLLPGSAELHSGADARLRYLITPSGPPPAVVHIATHAAVSLDHPERSRILFAAADGDSAHEYLYLNRAAKLDFDHTSLVTLSACDTERSRLIRGEGILGFSRAFLAAGARTTVSSLWKVPDDSTAALMERFYYELGRRRAPAEALRAAKLAFLDSGGALADPYYWAAFVMNGDGLAPIPLPWRWTTFLAVLAIPALLLLSWLLWRRRAY